MRRQPRKVSGLPPALAERCTLEPGDHPHDIHRRGSEQLLEVRARQTAVATLAHIKAPDALRKAALDTRPECIFLFELGRLLALAGGLHRFVVGLGADRELAWRILGGGTDGTTGTGATGGRVKPDPKYRIAGDIVAWSPFDTRMPLGTAGLLGLPIQDEGLQVIAVGDLVLPTILKSGGCQVSRVGIRPKNT
jgi:hypothetical protein